MDKVISTALLTIVAMLLVMVLFNAAYPAVLEGSDSIANMAGRMEEQFRSEIAIIHTGAEINAGGTWQDTNSNGDFEVFVWIKNIGDTRVVAPDQLDVFFGPEGNFARIPHRTTGTEPLPNWTWSIENAADWSPTATLKLVIHYGGAWLSSGRYYLSVTLPNGITDRDFIGL
ncbi:MAG: hypothetical protein IAE80_18395 [Anaerolinea sp.]|nr:hypothetical protein [Anaerolinea sp.]